jgi:hypothetical protein
MIRGSDYLPCSILHDFSAPARSLLWQLVNYPKLKLINETYLLSQQRIGDEIRYVTLNLRNKKMQRGKAASVRGVLAQQTLE